MLLRRKHVVTPVGVLESHWTEQGLYSCEFSESERTSPTDAELSASSLSDEDDNRCSGDQVESFENAILRFFDCGQMDWSLNDLDWRGVTDFQRDVLKSCFEIPCGETLSYGALAQRAGHPKAARAVGMAMARNRWPILIPCHRVVGSKGRLTGYSGAGGLATKSALLEIERSISNNPGSRAGNPKQGLLFT